MASTTTSSTQFSLLRRVLGRPSDWRLRIPRLPRLRPGLGWLGPLAIAASLAVSWPAFAGAQGEDGNVAFGLFIGAVAILLWAWSFVLAVRIPIMERFFGGLDSMYRAHRWAGTLGIIAMFLHTSAEPEVEGGIRGAAESVADSAEDLAGTGEIMFYILIALSLIRWFPYRYWRWTHKLLGIPFAFACWHFYTAEKTYANGSGWGWWFGGFMLAGLAAYIWRVVVRDMLLRGTRYKVSATETEGSTAEIRLAPTGKPMRHEAGQFAVLKIQERGLTEPHVFTIASPPDADELRFYIRDLGDWTAKLQHRDLVGTEVLVEGPYGTFEPLPHQPDRNVIWVAGGVGITPFLSAIGTLEPGAAEPPTLVYCVRNRDDATAIAELDQAAADGRIRLEVMASGDGNRFSSDTLATMFGDDVRGAHVAACGPVGLVDSVAVSAGRLGAATIETEDFDIRSGVGPDLSRDVENLLDKLPGRRSPEMADA